MKRAALVGLAIAIAVAGAWSYGELVRQEDDRGRPVQLLAIAEEQPLVLSSSRTGRIVTRVPDEGEAVPARSVVAKVEQPGLAEEGLDLERQRAEIVAREKSRQEALEKERAELAQVQSEERRMSRLVGEGIAPSADLETLQHRRRAAEAGLRARDAEKQQLLAQDASLEARGKRVRVFEEEGTLRSSVDGTVLTRHHRQGEWVKEGDPIVTLQVGSPYLRVEVPEERMSVFRVGGRVRVWPQARPFDAFWARVVSIKPREGYADRKNWGWRNRDLKTFSIRLAPEKSGIVAGQTFIVEAGKS